MILNPSDPTGLGLFSKCARNQAARLRSHRPASATKSKTFRSSDDCARKKLITNYTFAKQQSRQQRESKYRRDETPPVGQYNPIKKEHPKLVWDILKVYHHQIAKKKNEKLSASKENLIKSTQSIPTPQPQLEGEAIKIDQPIKSMASLCSQAPMSSVNKSQCVVNMSRMTGRKDEAFESVDWGNADLMQSVSYIKKNVAKNIYFDKQPKNSSKRYLTINPASTYSYDYKILKPRKNGLLDFSQVKGRQQNSRKNNQYAYQHYEYNNYVWQNNSKVFPNTKTHLVQFKKQTDRYKTDKSSQLLQL